MCAVEKVFIGELSWLGHHDDAILPHEMRYALPNGAWQ